MIRVVIENILLLLLPTLLYISFMILSGRAARKGGSVWDDAPLVGLFVAGVALVVAVVATFGTYSGGAPGQAYKPPSFEGGRIDPGGVKPIEPATTTAPAKDGASGG
ncbi:MAG: DUF6111 family protein [Hyphomicrobiaceae bacterium]|nr:DUF6111 family protein [Hyphomicrobiaceae bacterium]